MVVTWPKIYYLIYLFMHIHVKGIVHPIMNIFHFWVKYAFNRPWSNLFCPLNQY